MNKQERAVVSTLEASNEGHTLLEISQETELPEKKVFKILRKLFENGVVDCDKINRRYKLMKSDSMPRST
jgi:DNA-binding IclR family transcriptional regulator